MSDEYDILAEKFVDVLRRAIDHLDYSTTREAVAEFLVEFKNVIKEEITLEAQTRLLCPPMGEENTDKEKAPQEEKNKG